MIWLAAPLGLLALLALAVPLVVHLWRPPPQTVRIGSLRLLREASRLPVRDLRWRDRILLLLRCLLLLAAALLLAQPLWSRATPPGARWALRSPEARPTDEQSRQWAQWLREGFEERWLAPGFPRARPSEAMPPDAWSLLAEAAARIGLGGELAVLAPTALRSLTGSRPALARPVRWLATDGPGEAVWLAGRGPEEQVRVGVSQAGRTQFVSLAASTPTAVPGTSSKVQTRRVGDTLEASLDGGPWTLLPAVPPLRVTVLAVAERGEDARRVQAAVRALGWPLVAPNETPAWVVLLGDIEPPAGAGSVLRDAGSGEGRPAAGTFAGERLRRRVEVGPADGLVRERDAFGAPLLLEQNANGRRELRLLTRFHPDWMEAAATSALPLWLVETLRPESAAAPDLRTVDPRQAQPAVADAGRVFQLPAPAPDDLSAALWWALAALLVAERVLSHRPSANAV